MTKTEMALLYNNYQELLQCRAKESEMNDETVYYVQ